MADFSGKIVYCNKLLSASFNKIVAPQPKYYVEIREKNSSATSFEIVFSNRSQWEILSPAQDWIFEIKKDLVEIITKNEL
jgi:hypothetical protein